MQHQNDLAINLKNLFDPGKYKEFKEGDFINQPKMKGYFFIFQRISNPGFCLILNTSEVLYSSNMVKIKDFVFFVYNVSSLEEFVNNLSDQYFPSLLESINNFINKKNDRALPYGYYLDENGNLKVDLKKAAEVKKIYDRYLETGSVRDIAQEMRTNFSFIRDILHDNEEYMRMEHKIIPLSLIRNVNELLASNVRGSFRKQTGEDEVRAARARAKNLQKQSEQARQIASQQ